MQVKMKLEQNTFIANFLLIQNKCIVETYWTCSVITALYIVPTLKYNTIEKIKTCIFFINYFTKNL